MPKIAEDPLVSNGTPERRCYTRRHMPAAMSAFHSYALSLAHRTGIFYSNARRDAWEFGVDKETITAWQRWLEKEHWLRRIDAGPRRKKNPRTGMYAPLMYRVIGHDSWAANHPGRCRYPEPDNPEPHSDPGQDPFTHFFDVSNIQSGKPVLDQSGKAGQDSKPVRVLPSTSPGFLSHQSGKPGHSIVLSSERTLEKASVDAKSASPLIENLPAEEQGKGKSSNRQAEQTCPRCNGILREWIEHACPDKPAPGRLAAEVEEAAERLKPKNSVEEKKETKNQTGKAAVRRRR